MPLPLLFPKKEAAVWDPTPEAYVTPYGLSSVQNGLAPVCGEQGEPLAVDCGLHWAIPAIHNIVNKRLRKIVLRILFNLKRKNTIFFVTVVLEEEKISIGIVEF